MKFFPLMCEETFVGIRLEGREVFENEFSRIGKGERENRASSI